MTKPVIRVQERSPWGDLNVAESADDTTRDAFYLPGYSDKRREWELAQRAGERPAALPRRFQYVRVQRLNGLEDSTKMAEYAAKGYRTVQYDELKGLGVDVKAPDGITPLSAAVKAADGTVRVGDQLLMVCDAARVASHARTLRDLTDAQFDARVKTPLEREAAKYNAERGYNARSGTAFEIVDDEPRGA